MPPLQQQANAILNALEEGQVLATIEIVDKILLNSLPKESKEACRSKAIKTILVDTLKIDEGSVIYWSNRYLDRC